MKWLKAWLLAFGLFSASAALGDDTGGSGGGTGGNQQQQQQQPDQAAVLREENERLKREMEELKKKQTKEGGNGDGDDLRERNRREREAAEKSASDTKAIEKAVAFNMQIDDFVTKNAALLPSSIANIVRLANKETYGSVGEKVSVLKAAIIQEYFSVEANLENLTSSQKSALEDYLKLTKNAKEQKAADIYENIFEPALETVRKIKKAEDVARSRSGFANENEADASFKEKISRASRRVYLGQKE